MIPLFQTITIVYKSCNINQCIFLFKMGSLQMGHHILSNNHDFVSSSSGYLSPFTSWDLHKHIKLKWKKVLMCKIHAHYNTISWRGQFIIMLNYVIYWCMKRMNDIVSGYTFLSINMNKRSMIRLWHWKLMSWRRWVGYNH